MNLATRPSALRGSQAQRRASLRSHLTAALLVLGCFVAVLAGVRAAEQAPFTPEADQRGGWDFTVNPRLPNVLLVGDSISIGYTRAVRERLAGKANVHRPMRGKGPDNCGDTRIGMQKINTWLGTGTWDVIHFNWGLWDLCYRNPESRTQGNRDKVGGTLSVPLADYERNLEQLVARLRATGATLIWASTTVVPAGEAGRVLGDDEHYNAVAARVMKRHGIRTNDLHALTKGFGGKHSVRPDDVHFTPAGYGLIADAVADAVTAAVVARSNGAAR